jgi:hypothetical protein
LLEVDEDCQEQGEHAVRLAHAPGRDGPAAGGFGVRIRSAQPLWQARIGA